MFDGVVRLAVRAAALGDRDRPHMGGLVECAVGEHGWDRWCTTVMTGKPLVVEYRCRHCGAWTVEERDTW